MLRGRLVAPLAPRRTAHAHCDIPCGIYDPVTAQLAARTGPWAAGPTFAGSALIAADGDLIAAGLLLELKTSGKLTLAVKDLWQVIGYALLDFDDEYHLESVGIFSARYAYLATWGLGSLLADLAGHAVSPQSVRDEFREVLVSHSA